MPSAGKSVVELVTHRGEHVAWVEIGMADKPQQLTEPVVLLWGTRMFVWRTVSQAGFFVFAEASVVCSRTPSPGLQSPDGSGGEAAGEPPRDLLSPAIQARLAEQVGAATFGGRKPSHLSLVLVLTALREQARAVRLTTLANLVNGDLAEVEALVGQLALQGKVKVEGSWVQANAGDAAPEASAPERPLPTRAQLQDLRERIDNTPGKAGKLPWSRRGWTPDDEGCG